MDCHDARMSLLMEPGTYSADGDYLSRDPISAGYKIGYRLLSAATRVSTPAYFSHRSCLPSRISAEPGVPLCYVSIKREISGLSLLSVLEIRDEVDDTYCGLDVARPLEPSFVGRPNLLHSIFLWNLSANECLMR